ncbi:MAG: hypothetical protein ABIH49_01655 [archaeon]
MNVILIFVCVWIAFIAMAFWESSVEGRNAWDKKKYGWKIKMGKYTFMTRYPFFAVWVMIPVLLSLPLVIYGWDIKLFGVLISAFFSGIIIEDFFWYVVNPVVKLREFWTNFSDYYPWIKLGKKKVIPLGYVAGILIAFASWWFIWR